jgi:glucose/arabinose dehydrogenase/type 1 glutamine amidotransferase
MILMMEKNRAETGTAVFAALLLASGCGAVGGNGFAHAPPITSDPAVTLFDGTPASLEGWEQVGPGRFVLQPDGSIVSKGGMGLLYYAERPFRDFVLELEYRAEAPGANSGIFVRFSEQPTDPWDAVRAGYEVQIDDVQDPLHMTGSIYGFSAPSRLASRPAGEWNRYRIEVVGQRYQVHLNGEKVNDFIGERGREGYIGLQNHDPDSRVHFRDIRVTPLRVANPPETMGDLFAGAESAEPVRVLVVTATHGWRHHEAIAAAREVLPDVGRTTEFEFEFTEDLADLNREDLAGYDVLFLALTSLRADPPEPEAATGDTYAIALRSTDGVQDGRLFVDDREESLSGDIEIDGASVPLLEPRLTGGELRFAFDHPRHGRLDVALRLMGTGFEGTVRTPDGVSIPVYGNRYAGSGARLGSYTPVSEAARAAIVDFVNSGGGLAVAHSGLDAFYGWDEYREMVGGGLFEAHPWVQPVRLTVEDPTNPAVEHLDNSFWLRDEFYVLDRNPRWNSRVLLSLDMTSLGVDQGPADGTTNDHPVSWIRPQGEGRVFVTSLGHFEDVWGTPAFIQHLLQGLRIAAGRIDADLGGRRTKETIASDVWATNLAVDSRNNIWIVELTGEVHRWNHATGETELMGEIPTTDPAQIEHGLYDVLADPAFYDGEPYIYAYYAQPETFINTLSRFTVRDGRIDLSSEKVLLRVPTEPACCHQAGDMEWGPDGTLFISTGDTGQSGTKPEHEISQARIEAFVERNELMDSHWSRLADSERSAQNMQDLRGKMLRINKDGSIPTDNPFYGTPGVRWEIYASGLRNPYRFSYDAPADRLYIGVVGPDAQFDYDEHNVVTRGGENFGWPRGLGRLFYNEWTREMIPRYVPPMWEYTYATGSRSAHFGPVYRHEGEGGFPGMRGKIFLYDWSRKWIKYADVVNGTFESDTSSSVRTDGWALRTPAMRLANIRTFDVLVETSPLGMVLGQDGCLYVAEFHGFWQAGPKSNVSRYCWVEGDDTSRE